MVIRERGMGPSALADYSEAIRVATPEIKPAGEWRNAKYSFYRDSDPVAFATWKGKKAISVVSDKRKVEVSVGNIKACVFDTVSFGNVQQWKMEGVPNQEEGVALFSVKGEGENVTVEEITANNTEYAYSWMGEGFSSRLILIASKDIADILRDGTHKKQFIVELQQEPEDGIFRYIHSSIIKNGQEDQFLAALVPWRIQTHLTPLSTETLSPQPEWAEVMPSRRRRVKARELLLTKDDILSVGAHIIQYNLAHPKEVTDDNFPMLETILREITDLYFRLYAGNQGSATIAEKTDLDSIEHVMRINETYTTYHPQGQIEGIAGYALSREGIEPQLRIRFKNRKIKEQIERFIRDNLVEKRAA